MTALHLVEPDPHMLRRLRQRVTDQSVTHAVVHQAGAEQLPFADASVDTVIPTACRLPPDNGDQRPRGRRPGVASDQHRDEVVLQTTELLAYIAAAVGVLIASAVVDAQDFGAHETWFYVTLLTIGYMVSRGLAKTGSRDFHDDNRDGR